MFPKQHILGINETSNSAGKRAILHERGWRPCEPAQGGSCGILISSCGIKVRILGRQNFYMTPITMGLPAVRASNPTWRKRYWRPCELVWDGQCGILISSCGINDELTLWRRPAIALWRRPAIVLLYLVGFPYLGKSLPECF